MPRLSHLSFSISLALLAQSAPALAQEPTKLQTMTISATRANTEEGKTPQKVTVITREQIERQTAITTDIGQVLSNLLPSYSPGRQKMTSSGETLRGRSPLIMIDGVPQSTPLRDSARDGYTIDLSMVERIEVIHGASAEHGLGATGGIINYVTRRPEAGTLKQHVGASLTAPTDYESEGLGYKLDYRVSGNQGSWDYLAGATWQTRGMFYDADGRLIGVDDVQGDIMNSETTDLLLKLGYWFDDDQNLELMVNHLDIEGEHEYVGVPGNPAQGTPTTSVKGAPAGEAPSNEVLAASLSYKHRELAGNQLGIQLFTQRFRARFGGGIFGTFQDTRIASVGTLYDQSQNESDKLGAKFTLTRDGMLDDRLKLTGGLDLLQDTTSQILVATNREWVPETEFRNAAPFAQAELKAHEQVTLHAGVRHEFAKLNVDTFTTVAGTNSDPSSGVTVQGGTPSFEETLYNAGVVFQVTDWAQVFGNYSEGFGMPDVGRVLRGIGQPNQTVDTLIDLQPIVTDNREVGLRLNWQKWDAELSYYQSSSDLGSRLEMVGGTSQVRRERTEIDGLEASLGWQVTEAQHLQASYARSRGRSDTDGDGSVDTDLDGSNIAPNRIAMKWQSDWNNQLSTLVQANHYASRSFDTANRDFDGYTLVDASMGYRLPVGLVSLGLENVLNRDYLTYYSQATNASTNPDRLFTGRGRTLTLGYSVDF